MLLCLAVGTAVSWLVAFGHVLWSPETGAGEFPDEDAQRMMSGRVTFNADAEASFDVSERTGRGWRARRASVFHGGQSSTVYEFDQGWPLYSFRSVHQFGDEIRSRGLRGGFVARSPLTKPDRIIAFCPLLPNVLLNAFILAAPLVLYFAFDEWRRLRRRRIGRCSGCGYDLRGFAHSMCPECGERARDRARARQPTPARL